MGGFHSLDLIVIIGIALLIFGPKTLQSISHKAGRGVGQAKEAKDKLLAELPMEEISTVTEPFSRIPTSPQQAAHMLITPPPPAREEKTPPAAREIAEMPVQDEK